MTRGRASGWLGLAAVLFVVVAGVATALGRPLADAILVGLAAGAIGPLVLLKVVGDLRLARRLLLAARGALRFSGGWVGAACGAVLLGLLVLTRPDGVGPQRFADGLVLGAAVGAGAALGAVLGGTIHRAVAAGLWTGIAIAVGLQQAIALTALLATGRARAPFEIVFNEATGIALGAAIGGCIELWLRLPLAPPRGERPLADPDRRRAIAAAGLLAVANRDNLDQLESSIPGSDCRQFLLRDWEIRDAESTAQVLAWLADGPDAVEWERLQRQLSEGSSGRLRAVCRGLSDEETRAAQWAWRRRAFHRGRDILAWDAGRRIQVARWCLAAGYLDEAEAWDAILESDARIRSRYRSWGDYGASCLLGAGFCLARDPDPGAARAFRSALAWLRASPESPWVTLRWRSGPSRHRPPRRGARAS